MLTKDQEYVVDLVLKGHNVYIGGQAGTGKSYLLTHLFDKLTIAGKKVSVTCTTGIACTHFPQRCHASTIHSWAGMDDGRHESSEICDLLQNSVHYKQALHRILHCDVLILDEVSMLSKRLFEQLSTICSLKDGNYCFGNIQLVFSGDFLQLPPVKNSLYNEEGQFCFLSETFQRVFQHTVFLSEIKRQCDSTFIQTINEVSRGILSEDSNKYLSELNRPLDEKDSVKLFATNGLVDKYNRQCILQAKGQLYEYRAEDGGDVQHLSKVLAPPTLWLKKYCPVVLLRNLSDKLVNGLIGKVVSCGDDGPVVNFPSIDVTTKLVKINFSGNYLQFITICIILKGL
jgi:ATP-dependent DNA helicase PIF1